MKNEEKTRKQLLEELTELMKRFEEHRAHEKRYRDFVENVQDGCTEVDLEGRVIFSNHFFQKFSGYNPEEISRMKRWDWYPTREEYRRVIRYYTDILNNETPRLIHYKLKCKNGDIKDVEIPSVSYKG